MTKFSTFEAFQGLFAEKW